MDPVTLARFRQSCFERIFAILDDMQNQFKSAHKNTQCIRFENDDSNILIDDGTEKFQSNENVDPTKILLTNKAEPTPLDLDLCNHREILHGELVDDSVPDVEEQKEMDLQIVQSDHTSTHDHDFSNNYQAIKNEPISIPIHEINDEQVEKHVTLPTAIVRVPPRSEIVRSCSTPRQLVPAALFGSRLSFNFVSIESRRVYLPPKPPDIIAAPILSRKLSPSSSLTNFYSKGGYYTYACQMLDEMPEQDVVSFPQQHSVLCSIMFPPVSSRALLSGAYLLPSSRMRNAQATIPPPEPPDGSAILLLSLIMLPSFTTTTCCTRAQYLVNNSCESLFTAYQVFDKLPKGVYCLVCSLLSNHTLFSMLSLCYLELFNFGRHAKLMRQHINKIMHVSIGLMMRYCNGAPLNPNPVTLWNNITIECSNKESEALELSKVMNQGSITRGLQIMKECPQALFSKYLGLENYDSKGTINCYGGLHGIGSSTGNELETSNTITCLNEKCRGTVRNNAMDLKCLIVVWNCIEVTNETLEAGVDIDGKAIVLLAGVGWIGKPADEMLSLIGRLSSSQWYKTVFEDQIDAEANLGTFYLKDAKQAVEEIPNITPAQFMMEIVLHRKMIYNGIVQTAKGLLKWKALPPKHGTWKYSSLRTRMFEGAGIVTVNK